MKAGKATNSYDESGRWPSLREENHADDHRRLSIRGFLHVYVLFGGNELIHSELIGSSIAKLISMIEWPRR